MQFRISACKDPTNTYKENTYSQKRTKDRSEPPPPSPSPFFVLATADINYRSARNGNIFPGACGKVAALLCSPLLPKIVKEVNTRGASSVHRIVSRASCVRPINLPGLFSSSLPCARVIALVLYVPCTRPWQRATNRRLTRLTSRITEPRKTTYRRLFSSRRRIP